RLSRGKVGESLRLLPESNPGGMATMGGTGKNKTTGASRVTKKAPALAALALFGALVVLPLTAATTAAANDCTVTVTNPGPQVSAANDRVGLQIQATQSAGCHTLKYKAFDLPPKVHIDKSSGFISGTIGGPGDYTVTVEARDTTTSSDTTMFSW